MTTEHEIPVSGLLAASRYYYDVGATSEVLSGGTDDHFFYTSPLAGTSAPVRVWAIGDFGTNGSGQRAVRNAYTSFTGETYTNVWLFLGDNAYSRGTASSISAGASSRIPFDAPAAIPRLKPGDY